jgi:hypothetical protein
MLHALAACDSGMHAQSKCMRGLKRTCRTHLQLATLACMHRAKLVLCSIEVDMV